MRNHQTAAFDSRMATAGKRLWLTADGNMTAVEAQAFFKSHSTTKNARDCTYIKRWNSSAGGYRWECWAR